MGSDMNNCQNLSNWLAKSENVRTCLTGWLNSYLLNYYIMNNSTKEIMTKKRLGQLASQLAKSSSSSSSSSYLSYFVNSYLANNLVLLAKSGQEVQNG